MRGMALAVGLAAVLVIGLGLLFVTGQVTP